MSQISVEYVGKKDPYEDHLYGTGQWTPGEVKKVDKQTASYLLHHSDVWVDARTRAAKKKDPVTPTKKPYMQKELDREHLIPVNLANMDAKGLAAYARNTFNRDLDASRPVGELRAEVRNLMRMAP